MLGCLLDRVGNRRVRALGSEREMPCSLFRFNHDLRQLGVELPAALRPDAGDDCCREQRMRETNALAVQLDHAGG